MEKGVGVASSFFLVQITRPDGLSVSLGVSMVQCVTFHRAGQSRTLGLFGLVLTKKLELTELYNFAGKNIHFSPSSILFPLAL